MPEFHNQAWVTSALNEEEARNALILCFSLRRTFTYRRIVAVASLEISAELKEALDYGFDFVFYLDKKRNHAGLEQEDFVKIYLLAALRAFDNCAYLAPTMLVLKNSDCIFADHTEGFRLLEDAQDTSVFLFKPSIKRFNALMTVMRIKNGTGLGPILNKWTRTQSKDADFLDKKYNNVLAKGKPVLGYENSMNIVNLVEYLKESDIANLENTGILGKLVAVHWLKIQREDVLPLVNHSAPSVSSEIKVVENCTKEPIAIVGMSCRYPSSNNLEEFWNLLFQGQDGTCSAPDFRWKREQCSVQNAESRKTNAGFLKVPVDDFDAKFFGISPKEVLFMDPQHRLLHEMIWEGLEDACIDAQSLRGSSGAVFLGSWLNDYKDILMHSGDSEFYRAYMGNSIGACAARLSFLLGLTGPSIATESGCSSAMVALHLACKSLEQGQTNMALCCGVNLFLHPFDKDIMPMVISPEGHCRTFSMDANGFARAEGCGVLVLKRMSDALRDGDHIWGMIRGSAVSQEGVSKSMGTPTVLCESLAMENALLDAKVTPDMVSYVEAHGTGTAVGDPMEISAIAKAYNSPNRKDPLIIGSVKTNVGHTESCSGITGVMKVVLSMQHQIIPAHQNFTRLNPAIDLNSIPAVLPLERMEWKKVEGKPRFAGVSSFGITGTDAHVILEEAPQNIPKRPLTVSSDDFQRPLHILKLSAKTDDAMNLLLESYKTAIPASPETLADIAYSANTGRANFNIRAALIAQSKKEIPDIIEKQKYMKEEAMSESQGKICFLFTGQGSQYPRMAETLYKTSPVFRMHFDYCEKILKNNYNITIKDVLWCSSSKEEISRTIYSQTSIFCLEYALLKLWESWGVKADYCLGHSLGEFAAAVCAGILSVEDAIKLVAERSRLIDKLPRGKMLVIKADQQQVDKAMKRFAAGNQRKILDYAAVNSAEQTVVAGDSDVILDFSTFCINNKMKCIVLEATHAFHSKHMDPVLDLYRNVALTVVNQGCSKCEYISGVKGDLVLSDSVDAEYWVQHTREQVSFLDASKKAVGLGCKIFLEIGPQPVLSALTMMNNDLPLTCLPSLKRNEQEWSTLLTSISTLYVKGVEIDWAAFDQFYARKKVRLPHYPFIGKKFWPDLLQSTGNVIHPLIGAVIPNASSAKLFQCGLNLKSHEYIKDHAIGQIAVFPGAAYLEMCLAAGHATIEGALDAMNKPTRPMKVENLRIQAPLAVDESKTAQLQTVVELNRLKENEHDWNDVSVKIFHRIAAELAEKWLSHASATFSPLPTAEELNVKFDKSIFEETLSKPFDDESIPRVYDKLASVGLKFGPVFQSLEKMWKIENNKSILTKVRVPPEAGDGNSAQYIIHPAVLDAMIQAIMMLKLTAAIKRKLYVPVRIGKFLWLSDSASESRYIYVSDNGDSSGGKANELSTQKCSAILLDDSGKVLAIMADVEYLDTTEKTIESVLRNQTCPLPDLWDETWRPKTGPLQYTHNHEVCAVDKLYTEEFYSEVSEKYNKFGPRLSDINSRLNKLIYLNMIRCLHKCGFNPTLNAHLDENVLISELKIETGFKRMFGYILRVVEEEGIVKSYGPGKLVVTGTPPTLEEVETELSTPALTSDLLTAFKCTQLISNLGEHLHGILTGNVSALSILFPGENATFGSSAGDFYNEYGELFHMKKVIRIIAHHILTRCKTRHAKDEIFILRICEVGAGTGVFTEAMIGVLEELGFEFELHYTDISMAFFPAAEKRFEKHLKNIEFKKLNIEEDPISQGFTPGYYDIIVASDVVHATRNLKETFNHVNMLLKPGGRFDILEQIAQSRIITYVFGFLDGFWRFEDTNVRPNHCTLSKEKWLLELQGSGFEEVGIFPFVNNYHAYISVRKSTHISNVLKNQTVSYPSREQSCRKTWVLFHHSDSPTSTYLLHQIPTLTNRKLVVVERGAVYGMLSDGNSVRISINPDSEEDYVKLIKWIETSKNSSIEGFAYCWSLDKTCTTQDKILRPLLYLTKSIILGMQRSMAGLKLIALTDGVMSTSNENSEVTNFYTSTICGLIKALRHEQSELGCRCVDIGGNETEAGFLQTLYELWHTGKETQAAYCGTTRYIPKIVPLKPALSDLKLPTGTDRYCLILPETKSIEDLQFGPLEPIVLGEGQVEIQVKASALNFRDVLSVLKPSDDFKNSNSVGFDFAGVVRRVGSNVTKWTVGDNVFGVNIARTALPSHFKLHQDDLLAVPKDFTYGEASTLPAVVATSYHCLIDIAKITSSDTVLIHTASGGVGLSAIQICKHVGSTIIATAGSKRKQRYLQSLGIRHIFHSRSTQYEKDILKLTNGRGVDVVLNSLTSEGFKEATLNCCAMGARFVEMSKLSIWEPEEVQRLRPDVQYTTIDLTQMTTPEWRRLMANVEELAKKNVIRPIPYVRFDGVHIREALQYMQKAKHIGKVVVALPEIRCGGTEIYTPLFHGNATYLITGGLGGIGFLLCQWMVDKGAKYIVLCGRNPPNADRKQKIAEMNAEHLTSIVSVQLDVSNFDQCKELIETTIHNWGYPALRGVLHAAGTLSDATVDNQTWEKYKSTFSSKVDGTLNLHLLTKDLNLEHFVLFSSIAALFGSPGQSNHSAGNMFEDTLAHYRYSMGLPATTINWGQWGEVGVATEVDWPGMKPFSNFQGLAGLEYALKSQRTQTGAVNIESFLMLSKLFAHVSTYVDERVLRSSGGSSSGSINLKPDEFWQQYDTMETLNDKVNLLKETLKFILRKILKLDDTDIVDDNGNFQEMGVDSLMFVEIKNSLQSLLGSRISINVNVLRDCNTAQLLADALVKVIEGIESEDTKPPTAEEVTQLIHEDCALPEHIRAQPEQQRVQVQDISSVLLTGVTGTLGPYILRELCKQAQITQIICLLRPKGNLSGQQRLLSILKERCLDAEVDMDKIRCVDGNVASPNLGVEPIVWEELCNNVDAVFHCAACVQHMEQYRKRDSDKDMRAVNIGGTKRILEFSCTGTKLKHIYLASSLVAATTTNVDGTLTENWPELEDYDGVTTLAYPITKFVADVLLKQAVLKRGIPGKAFRFPLIVGDSKTGRFLLDQNHVMLRYFFILKSGVMPSNPFPMNMLPVDICAWVSVKLFFNPATPNDVYNIANVPSDPDQEFTRVAQKLGYNVEIVEFEEFAQRVLETTADDSPFAIFKDFYKLDLDLLSLYNTSPALRNWMLGEATHDFMTSKKIIKYLPEFYNDSSTAMDHVYRDMMFAKSQGWLDKYI